MTDRTHEQVIRWLGAYYDGELTPALREQVTAHVASCVECQAELEGMRALSQLLSTDPLPEPRTSGAEFTSQVLRRLPAGREPLTRRVLRGLWQGAPLAMLAGWAFCQAVLWVAGGAFLAMRLIPGGAALVSSLAPGALSGLNLPLPGLLFALPAGLPEELLEGLASPVAARLPLLDWIGPLILVNLVLLTVTAVLFAAWLAAWYAYRNRSINSLLIADR